MRENLARIMVVGNEPAVVEYLARTLRGSSRRVKSCFDAQTAVEQAGREKPDLLVADLGSPGMSGVELSRRLQAADPELEVILVTGDSVDWSSSTLSAHTDWVANPFQGPRLRWVAERALERHRLRRENRILAAELSHSPLAPLTGARSKAARIAMQKAEAFIKSSDTLLWISGESGVGKRSLARWVHEAAGKEEGPPMPLLMLNAYEAKPERLDDLDEGTLVLSHAEAMPAAFGLALLKRHEERVSNKLPLGMRVIFLTEARDLPWFSMGGALGGLGRLLETHHIHLPPLRQRGEDVFPLLSYNLREWSQRHDAPLPMVELAALRRLERHPWPGNARELREVVQAAMGVDPKRLTAGALSEVLKLNAESLVELDSVQGKTLEDIEKQVLRATLSATHGDKAETARQLGISVRTLYRKLRLNQTLLSGFAF